MFWIVFLGFFALLLLAAGAVLGWCVWRHKQRLALLECPRSRVAELRPGFRKIRGKIAPVDNLLRSLVSNKDCVYFRLHVYEDKRKVTGGGLELPGGAITAAFLFGWIGALIYRVQEIGADTRTTYSRHSLLDADDEVPVVVEDETGCVEVDLRGATILAKEKARVVSDDNHPPPTHLEKLLREEYDFDTVDRRGFFKRLHFIEEWLPVGAKVTVLGSVEQRKSGALCFWKDDFPLLVSDGGLAKEIDTARSRALGYTIGSIGTLAVGLGCLFGFVLLAARALRH